MNKISLNVKYPRWYLLINMWFIWNTRNLAIYWLFITQKAGKAKMITRIFSNQISFCKFSFQIVRIIHITSGNSEKKGSVKYFSFSLFWSILNPQGASNHFGLRPGLGEVWIVMVKLIGFHDFFLPFTKNIIVWHKLVF